MATSPGTRYRHYQPSCRVELAPAGEAAATAGRLAATGARVGVVGLVEPGEAPGGVVTIARVEGAGELAAVLYAALRDAEDAGVDVVVVETVPEHGIGRAVMDRLRRAAGASGDGGTAGLP